MGWIINMVPSGLRNSKPTMLYRTWSRIALECKVRGARRNRAVSDGELSGSKPAGVDTPKESEFEAGSGSLDRKQATGRRC